MFVDQEFDVVGTKATMVGFANRKEDDEGLAIKEELGLGENQKVYVVTKDINGTWTLK